MILHERIAALPVWSPPPRPGRAAVVVAHPDDETLALGGPIDALARGGWTLDILVLTDGEAAFPGADSGVRTRLARTRRGELGSAWAVLTAGTGGVPMFAGLPDSGLHSRADDVRAAVNDAVEGSDLMLGIWPGDPHPDHAAAGTAVIEAAAVSRVPALLCPLWALVWWDDDDPRLPWDTALHCPVDAAAASRRRRALAAHASQVHGFAGHAPVIPAAALDVLLGCDTLVLPT